jgi:hypothetical protein
MATAAQSPASRNWADLLTILTGVALLAVSIWPAEPTASVDAHVETGDPQAVWSVRLAAGVIALSGVFVAQSWRRRALARALIIGAALALLVSLAIFRDFGPRALLGNLLPGLILLATSVAIGPLPRDARAGAVPDFPRTAGGRRDSDLRR